MYGILLENSIHNTNNINYVQKKLLDVRETKLIKSFNFCKYLIAINRRK